VQDEPLRLLKLLTEPSAAIQRSIDEVEQKIKLAELEETLRKIKEDPDPADAFPTKPSMEQVRASAARHRATKVPVKK
jgi:hypothetical protein